MNNWTKGPWIVDEEYTDQGSKVTVIRNSSSDYAVSEYGVNQEDAKLISKAPDMVELLEEAQLQIEYLHNRFKETGSGNNVLSRIDALLKEIKE
jgi:hypothetical protein